MDKKAKTSWYSKKEFNFSEINSTEMDNINGKITIKPKN